MQEKYMENSVDNIEIWKNNPVEEYINNSLIPAGEYELIEFDKKVLNSISVDIDKNTGKVRKTRFAWDKIGKAMMEEITIYASAKKIPHINPIKNIAVAIEARKRTKILEEFYSEYISSGKYQAELVKACECTSDPEEIYDTIVIYLKGLKGDLERRLEGRRG